MCYSVVDWIGSNYPSARKTCKENKNAPRTRCLSAIQPLSCPQGACYRQRSENPQASR